MSADFVPTFTRAGLAAVRNAQGTGVQAEIAQIAVGRGVASGGSFVGYAPTGTEVALKGEVARAPLLSGAPLGAVAGSDPIGFRVLAQIPALTGAAAYPVCEVGIFLTDGTLLCLWSSASPNDVLGYVTSSAALELALDLFLSAVPVSALTIIVQEPDIPDTTAVLAELLSCGLRAFIADLAAEKRAVSRGVY